jgi:hypothetical protein
MLNQEFCENLEFALTKAFSISSDPTLKGFWCDGIFNFNWVTIDVKLKKIEVWLS